MRPVTVTTTTLTDDANGIAEDQTLAAAGDLTLNGDLVSGGIATAAAAQKVSIEGAGDNDLVNYTITGTDADGTSYSEVLAGADNGTSTTTGYFETVTEIAADDAIDGNVEAGWLKANGAVSRSIVTNWRNTPYNQAMFTIITGTLTYTVQHTAEAPEDTYTNTFQADATWRTTTGLSALTTSDKGNIAFPVRAVRMAITAYTSGTTSLTSIQGN